MEHFQILGLVCKDDYPKDRKEDPLVVHSGSRDGTKLTLESKSRKESEEDKRSLWFECK